MTDWSPVILSFSGLLFALANAYGVMWIQKHFKDQAAEATIQNAYQNALGAMQQAEQSGLASHPLQKDIPGVSPMMATGLQYMMDQASNALARKSVTTDEMVRGLDARVGVLNIKTNQATAASPAPTPQPLAAVQKSSEAPPALVLVQTTPA